MSMRDDPPVSEAQRRAMWAASEGKGNLGIPKSVGKEFANADPGGKLPEHKGDARADAVSRHLDSHGRDCADAMRDHPAMGRMRSPGRPGPG